jgi:chemotaxis protein CheZ
MMAQDFHDLTGQVIKKVVDLAGTLEVSLVALLVEPAAREEARRRLAPTAGDGHRRPKSSATRARSTRCSNRWV